VIAAFSGLAAGQTLRYLAIRTLAECWSTRIYVVPDAPLIKHGIYRFVRHPNYLGVILEIASVPLLHAAYGTAVVFSLANLIILRHRIRLEELALDEI
jgi:methyltransferase